MDRWWIAHALFMGCSCLTLEMEGGPFVDRWWIVHALFMGRSCLQNWRMDCLCTVRGSFVPCFNNGGWVTRPLMDRSCLAWRVVRSCTISGPLLDRW